MYFPRIALLTLLLGFMMSLPAMSQQQVRFHNLSLQNGDLLFVGAEKDKLSGAINRVTQRQEDISFDHVGILELDSTGIFVLHASGKKGSVREPLDSLIQEEGRRSKRYEVYRLTEEYQPEITQALQVSKTLLGKPYNWSYVLNDSTLYCSDFVERSFRHGQIFTLKPMTFVNPATGKIDEYWLEFYRKQGIEVPEGELGCNPNGLAGSDKLVKVGILKIEGTD